MQRFSVSLRTSLKFRRQFARRSPGATRSYPTFYLFRRKYEAGKSVALFVDREEKKVVLYRFVASYVHWLEILTADSP